MIVIINLISMRGGEIMREFLEFILSIAASNKPVRLMEDWSLRLQMAR